MKSGPAPRRAHRRRPAPGGRPLRRTRRPSRSNHPTRDARQDRRANRTDRTGNAGERLACGVIVTRSQEIKEAHGGKHTTTGRSMTKGEKSKREK